MAKRIMRYPGTEDIVQPCGSHAERHIHDKLSRKKMSKSEERSLRKKEKKRQDGESDRSRRHSS